MKKFYDKLIQTRHYLHRHPELSGQEYQTTDFLKKYLEDLEIRILDSNLKTGLIAEIGSGQPIIALRADIVHCPFLNRLICLMPVKIQVSCMPVDMIFIRQVS